LVALYNANTKSIVSCPYTTRQLTDFKFFEELANLNKSGFHRIVTDTQATNGRDISDVIKAAFAKWCLTVLPYYSQARCFDDNKNYFFLDFRSRQKDDSK
jgi:hypothetical protein